jgi:hypothetical protein
VLREKFIEAYNEFVSKRPEGETVTTLQQMVETLYKEEKELAALRMQRLITESIFREEQKRIKAEIAELNARIVEQRGRTVTESDYTQMTEFDEEKMKKFITKVVVTRWLVTFVFYNGVRISRTYTNGQAGNKPGWNKKEAI